MRLLIAHGDAKSRDALERVAADLADVGVEVITSGTGMETVETLLAADAPAIAVVDWDLPECDGPEICRLVRAYRRAGLPYIILLARSDHPIAEGLDAGANDCVHTPAKADELLARISVGRRFAALPWHRVTGAGASNARTPAEDVFDAAPALDAQRFQDDDLGGEQAAASEPGFELKSVLFAQ